MSRIDFRKPNLTAILVWLGTFILVWIEIFCLTLSMIHTNLDNYSNRLFFKLSLLKLLAFCHVVLQPFPSMSFWSQNDAIKVVTFTMRIKMAVLFWIRLDQICPKWIKLHQIGSNWIKKDQDGSGWLFGSNQIKLVQKGSTWIKLVQISSN